MRWRWGAQGTVIALTALAAAVAIRDARRAAARCRARGAGWSAGTGDHGRPVAQQRAALAGGLRGRVVFVEFWTYGCVNCRNVLPQLRAWHERYTGAGLTIVGVHSPEFLWEKPYDRVAAALRELDVRYPVVQDNGFAIWKRYDTWAWPTGVLVDHRGVIRYARTSGRRVRRDRGRDSPPAGRARMTGAADRPRSLRRVCPPRHRRAGGDPRRARLSTRSASGTGPRRRCCASSPGSMAVMVAEKVDLARSAAPVRGHGTPRSAHAERGRARDALEAFLKDTPLVAHVALFDRDGRTVYRMHPRPVGPRSAGRSPVLAQSLWVPGGKAHRIVGDGVVVGTCPRRGRRPPGRTWRCFVALDPEVLRRDVLEPALGGPEAPLLTVTDHRGCGRSTGWHSRRAGPSAPIAAQRTLPATTWRSTSRRGSAGRPSTGRSVLFTGAFALLLDRGRGRARRDRIARSARVGDGASAKPGFVANVSHDLRTPLLADPGVRRDAGDRIGCPGRGQRPGEYYGVIAARASGSRA